MTIYVGGLRARLIKDSVYYMVRDAMEELGWFDPSREHARVHMIAEPLANDVEIKPNIITLDDDAIISTDQELGSNLSEHSWDMIFDVYAENSAVGIQMAVDIRDILQGRFNSLGRTAPVVQIFDYTQATPSPIFVCNLENISYDRVRSPSKSWQKYWFVVFFSVVDEYENEEQNYELYLDAFGDDDEPAEIVIDGGSG